MWIKTEQRIILPQITLEAGGVHDVYDAMGMYLLMRGWAKQVPEPADAKERFLIRLANGGDQPCLFLPFVGEFGHQILYHMRMVHYHQSPRKTVCCRPGHQVLYPSAAAFDLDWIDPVDDATRAGTDRLYREWPEISTRHAGDYPVQAGGLSWNEEMIAICPEKPIAMKPKLRGLKVDVCIGTRNRKFLPEKNWPHWPAVSAAIRAEGLTFAVIGTKSSSYELDGMECMSGDYGDIDAAVELLQSCRVYAGTDSGGAHLASTVGVPMVVQTVPNSRSFIHRMQQVNPRPVVEVDDWASPGLMIESILKAATAPESMSTGAA